MFEYTNLQVYDEEQFMVKKSGIFKQLQIILLVLAVAQSSFSGAGNSARNGSVILQQGQALRGLVKDGVTTPTPYEISPTSHRDLSTSEIGILRSISYLEPLVDSITKFVLFGASSDFEVTINNAVAPFLSPLRNELQTWEKFMYYHAAQDAVQSQLTLLGLKEDPLGIKHQYTSWETLNAKMRKSLSTPSNQPLCTDQNSRPTSNDNERIREFFKFIPSHDINRATKMEALGDNDVALQKRINLIESAKHSLDILTWGFFEGVSSTKIITALKKQSSTYPELKIRIIIDRFVKRTFTFATDAVISQLRQLPNTDLIEFHDPWFSFGVQHRKVMIADGKKAIIGSRNFSDYYLRNISERYSDMDIYYEGPITEQTQLKFNHLWGQQKRSDSNQKGPSKYILKCDLRDNDQEIVGVISEQPSEFKGRPSLTILTILNAIRNAKRSIRIANAYLVEFPVLIEELKAAADRGVNIELFTNSSKSNDSPIINIAILNSAFRFKSNIPVARVLLKKGNLFHYKVMVVDGIFSMVGSYNIHPRSEKIDGEFNLFIWDRAVALSLSQFINKVVSEDSIELTNPSQIKLRPPGKKCENPYFETTLVDENMPFYLRMFYDQI